MLIDSLRNYLLEFTQPQALADAQVGRRYAAVQLADGSAGLAYSDLNPKEVAAASSLRLRLGSVQTTTELYHDLGSANPAEASVALAAANAVLNRFRQGFLSGDVLEVLAIGREDRIGMVGYFQPLVASLRNRAQELLIFERRADLRQEDGVLPAEEMPERLGGCDIALITSAALVNGTLESVLAAAAGCREKVLLGASTPLIPEVFGRYGVTLLAGVIVTDAAAALDAVIRGGGARDLRAHTRKVAVRI